MDIEINDYEILDRANQFRDAVEILKKSNKLIPTELNACLACELYLKYLVYFEKDGVIRSVDLRGMFINDYNICVFNNLYVDDGVIYYYDFDGVKSYATDTNNIWLYVEDDDIYNFIVTDKGVVYTNTDNELYYYFNDGGEVYFIGDDVFNFNVIGDKVIYCDNEGYSWFISDGYELVSEFLEQTVK